jgi:hypothetical protein
MSVEGAILQTIKYLTADDEEDMKRAEEMEQGAAAARVDADLRKAKEEKKIREAEEEARERDDREDGGNESGHGGYRSAHEIAESYRDVRD